jgi:Asp/Glu/hydantoin racemase
MVKSMHTDVPILKIDDAMAAAAVRAGRTIGVAITSPPTQGPTTRLLEEAASEAGLAVELVRCVVPEAYDALLAGAPERHDELLLAAIEKLRVDAVVLAQVSMARLLPMLKARVSVPLFSSLETSLEALRMLSPR